METRSQLNFLQRHGCTDGQGYYFSRPLEAEHAIKLFETGLTSDSFDGPTIPS